MKKDWKYIEGQLVRIDIGSTFEQSQSDSTDAAIICFTTDGHIVLNGVDYVLDTDGFKAAAQTSDWVRKYIQMGDASHPFLQGRLTDDTYNIGWMLDGFTYNESVKIPLVSDEQQGLVDSQSYTDYLQPLLKGEYDEQIDAVKKVADANAAFVKNYQGDVEWLRQYVRTDRSNVGKPFLKYQFDTDNSTLDIGWLTELGYAYTVRIPLVDDTHNVFFDPYYYSEFIQPLFNGDYALQDNLDKVEEKADANASAIEELKKNGGGSSSYTLPMATKDVLGGVKVGGDVRASENSLPLDGAAISREIDGTILVPYAYASKRGEAYDRDGAMTKAQVRKLYEIEAKAQVNKIESIKVNGVAVSVDADKCANIVVSGSSGSASDTEAINALNAKVEQMQQEIEELKKLLMMA